MSPVTSLLKNFPAIYLPHWGTNKHKLCNYLHIVNPHNHHWEQHQVLEITLQLSIRSCSCNGVRLTRHTDNLTYRNLLTLNKRATVSLIFTGCFTLVLIQFKCCSTHALLQCFGSVTLISCSIHGLQNIAFPSIATDPTCRLTRNFIFEAWTCGYDVAWVEGTGEAFIETATLSWILSASGSIGGHQTNHELEQLHPFTQDPCSVINDWP